MSIAHKKNINPLLHLLINCISIRSAPQILSINDDCTFLFLNFLIIGLCNSSANSLFEMFSFLIVELFREAKVSDRASVASPLEVFYQNIYRSFNHEYIVNLLYP